MQIGGGGGGFTQFDFISSVEHKWRSIAEHPECSFP